MESTLKSNIKLQKMQFSHIHCIDEMILGTWFVGLFPTVFLNFIGKFGLIRWTCMRHHQVLQHLISYSCISWIVNMLTNVYCLKRHDELFYYFFFECKHDNELPLIFVINIDSLTYHYIIILKNIVPKTYSWWIPHGIYNTLGWVQ